MNNITQNGTMHTMTNNKQQTAVDWLVEQLKSRYDIDIERLSVTDKAKEMEKEQIIDAAKSCNYIGGATNIEAEQYYNETYNN
jgi:hypothetical protein